MIQKIRDYIRQYQIIRPQDHLICGVSGGADSVCLFLVLKELQQELNISIEAVHVEHGIRGQESCRDMEFTKELCRQYQVPCTVVQVEVPEYAKAHGLGTEEAARILRYKAFQQRAIRTGGKIALAHHMDDNAETVIFQMLRGSGVKGMSGMNPVRKEGEVEYIRPLLCVTRKEIEAYLSDKGQHYCTDSTNMDVDYDRNRLRHLVIPELEQINSQAIAHINQTAGMMAEAWDYIRESVDHVKPLVIIQQGDEVSLKIKELQHLHPAIKNELVLEAISMAAGRRKDIAAVHVMSVLELAQKQSGKSINLPYDIVALRQYDEIILSTATSSHMDKESQEIDISSAFLEACKETEQSIELESRENGGVITFAVRSFQGEMDEIPKKSYTKWLDYDKIKRGFSIRKRMAGDYFINDSQGHRKKLKQYFIDEKIPASKRDEIWLLTMGNQVIDIIGGRMAEPFKVSEDTREILEIRYDGGNYNGF